jgi:hypothetical protein
MATHRKTSTIEVARGGVRRGRGRPKGAKNKKPPVPKTITLRVRRADLAKAKCANPKYCALAIAIDRQLGLAGRGNVHVDANEAAWTEADGSRVHYHQPAKAAGYVRTFDEIGAEKGEEIARAAMPEDYFTLTFLRRAPKRIFTPKQKQEQVAASHKSLLRQKLGLPPRPKKRLRYTGM